MSMWRGEVDLETLSAGIDPESAALVKLILHADDKCYQEQHRLACEEREMSYVDPTYMDENSQQQLPGVVVPEGVPGTERKTTREHVLEMFEICQAMASQSSQPPMDQPTLRLMEWQRFVRCAKALPNQPPQLGQLPQEPVRSLPINKSTIALSVLRLNACDSRGSSQNCEHTHRQPATAWRCLTCLSNMLLVSTGRSVRPCRRSSACASSKNITSHCERS